MTVRTSKQILYGTFYFVIWVGVFSFAYFYYIKPAPSCFDGKLNQNEEGVDCGGVCAKICIPAGLQPLEVGRVLMFRHSPTNLTALFQVTNPNASRAAQSFKYIMRLYGMDGELTQSIRGSSFLYAREGKQILEPNISLASQSLGSIDVKIENVLWATVSSFGGQPLLSLSGVKTVVGEGGAAVEGRILNEDTTPFSRITVIAVLYGMLGQVAGASQTFVENLSPNDSRVFSIVYPNPPAINTGGTKVFVYAARP